MVRTYVRTHVWRELEQRVYRERELYKTYIVARSSESLEKSVVFIIGWALFALYNNYVHTLDIYYVLLSLYAIP